MQNGDKKTGKENNVKKTAFFKALTEKLRQKDEIEVRARLSALFNFSLTAAISYILGGAKLFFGIYPFCIILLCSGRRRLLASALALLMLAIQGKLPDVYIFTSLAIPLIRILGSFLPALLAELKEAPRTPTAATALVCYTPHVPANAPNTDRARLRSRATDEADRAKSEDNDCELSETEVRLFEEAPGQRALSSLIGGLLCGIFLLIQNDFSMYALWGALSLMLLCPIAVFIYGGYLGTPEHENQIYLTVSMIAIGVACIYAAKPLSIIGMPMSPFLAMLLTLYVTTTRGLLVGGISSILFGLILDPVQMPLLLVSSLLFSLISAVKRGAGLAVVCAAVVVWCYYIGGTHGLTEILPPMLLAIPVYMLAAKYRDMIHAPYDKSAILAGGIYFAEAVTEKTKNSAVRERLGALSEAFSVLSENFYKLSDRRRRPDALGLKRLCEGAFEKNCEDCPRHEICWGDEYSSTLDAITRAAVSLHKKGRVEGSDLEGFNENCIRIGGIVSSLNDSLLRATEDIIKNDKLGFFASSYEDINEILRDALECDTEDYECDREAQEKILDIFFNEGFRASGAVVYGKRCKHITVKGVGSGASFNAKRAAVIRREIEKAIGSSLTDPVFEAGLDGGTVRLSSRPLFRARYAYGHISANDSSEPTLDTSSLYVDPFRDNGQDGDEPCGDTSNAFITSSSYFYSLISDGMGSGQEAAFISGVCSMFIEKMLSAGNRSDITVRMLNNVLRGENMGRGGECSATVDLCELDLISGTASFLKSGAAPTYIARGGTVYKVYSRTMPIGILKNTDARISKFDTQKGDIIIMMSDGCCPDSQDCPWLVEYLCEYMSRKDKNASGQDAECESLKETLLSLAKKNFPADKECDDISVSVIFVE